MSVFAVSETLEATVKSELKDNVFFMNTMNKKILADIHHMIFKGRVKEWWLIVFGVIKTTMRLMGNVDITSNDLTVVANLVIQMVDQGNSRLKPLQTIRDCSVNILQQIQQHTHLSKAFNSIRASVRREMNH
jgi:hypothetical protein